MNFTYMNRLLQIQRIHYFHNFIRVTLKTLKNFLFP